MAGTKDKNLEQELVQKPQKSAAYWLAPGGLLSLLSYISCSRPPAQAGPTQSVLSLRTNWSSGLFTTTLPGWPQDRD